VITQKTEEFMQSALTGEWKIHKDKLYALFFSPNTIQVIKSRILGWAGNVAYMGGGEVHTGLGGKLEGKRPLGSARRRWEDNIKIDLRDM
jgi:hypothetical protein